MPNQHFPSQVGILYLGGTIGCAGRPLMPLSADTFLPHLATILKNELTSILQTAATQNKEHHSIEWHYFSGKIKDSSALVPEDWSNILELLLDPHHSHIQNWIILHGTDTLSFTAAFLSAALQGSNLRVVVTGSQLPLLDQTQFSLDKKSDALDNIKTALSAFTDHANCGWVRVAFNHTHWIAEGVQKIHTHDQVAFTGQRIKEYPISNQNKPFTQRQALLKQSHRFRSRLAQLNIQIYYASPLPLDILVSQLEQVLTSGAEAVILLAYGLGNFQDDLRIHRALLAAEQRGVMVILSTQVSFGGIEPRYAAGNWLAACGVLSGGLLPVSTIFARLTWLQITIKTFSERRQQWLEYLSSVSHEFD